MNLKQSSKRKIKKKSFIFIDSYFSVLFPFIEISTMTLDVWTLEIFVLRYIPTLDSRIFVHEEHIMSVYAAASQPCEYRL